jgi:hypothetical protein
MVTFHEADHAVTFPIEGVEFVPTWTEGAKVKLMAEFTARRDGLLNLRLEYSDECFMRDDMEGIAELMIAALDGLTSGADYEGVTRARRAIGSRRKESTASSSLAPVSL